LVLLCAFAKRGEATVSDQHPHVLLIEDNPGDADLVRLRLVESRSDVDVRCVDRLSAGLSRLSEEQPAVVLLDLNLPDSHGADTFRKVLSKAPGVPVVVLSGQDDEELALKAVHQGVQDYLVKGNFDSKQLSRALRYAMERQALITSLDMSRRQQLQFKDQFLSHVSHELRTPLTSIYQFTTILLDGLAGDLNAEQREHLETMLRSAKQLRGMIGDLLEATRAESGKISIEPRCLVATDVIQHAVSMMKASAQEKRIGLEAAVDTRIPMVYADPDRALQALLNLIENAIKFTPSEGSVMVKACLVEADHDFVYVSVADTGRGITPEARNLIFERLYQDPNSIDDSRKGLGLGLYITRELIRLHGGRIWVESQLGHGTVFSFTLPLFSMAKLLKPVIAMEGRLRDSISLITVELSPQLASSAGNWERDRRQCLQLLRSCVLPDKDTVLPPFENTSGGELFLVVASTNEHGAKILEKRIREQLEHSQELKTGCVFQVATTELQLPSQESGESIEQLVQKIADVITEIATLKLQQTGNSNGHAKNMGNLAGQQTIEGRIL
jgi:signal transduction histidine kinase